MDQDRKKIHGFTVESTFAKCSTLSDKALSLIFHTSREQSNHDQTATVLEMAHRTGWLLFKPDPIQDTEIPDKPTTVEGKSPSQRLRAVLYLLYRQNGSKDTFNTYYEGVMEKLIEHYKLKLI